ncbi:MAG: dihydrodipicolinate synthase family protein [Gemmatimonadetes bacterium]|nr:dihydrodipicolinate synthase family protein [Gemmatimonadota bacterium]MBT6146734.1 dihydrodipicolinate synthase family protein [Gemmatimonadota bacterium]
MNDHDLRQRLKTVHAYAVTPFLTQDLLCVDEPGLAANLQFLVDAGVQVINVGGGTGEIDALTTSELVRIAEIAFDTVGDGALITPTLPGNTGAAVELAYRYRDLGARACLAMAPYQRHGIPDDPRGIADHLRVIGEAVPELGLLPYNTQGWSVDVFQMLAEVEAVIGVKDPCFNDLPLFQAIQRLGDRFVWIGNKRHDPGVLHLRYQAGIEGFTAGFINFVPHAELELERQARAGDWEGMVEGQRRLAPLERLRNQFGDATIKAGMDLVGLAGGRVRPPRVDMSDEGREALADELRTTWGVGG